MNSRERVVRTLEFNNPDRIPVDLWVLPATRLKYGPLFEDLLAKHERDIVALDGPLDLSFNPKTYQTGAFVDDWGSEWTVLQAGMVGEVKRPILSDFHNIHHVAAPMQKFKEQWSGYQKQLDIRIKNAREEGRFILGGWISLFERMQFLRGTENLYCDIAEENREFFQIRDLVFDFYEEYLKAWLETDVDGIVFGDDWGSQRALLISPAAWRRLFRGLYQKLFDLIKAKGKFIFFHSDGYIMDLYPEFIEMGVNAINSQLWCMGVENVAAQYAGKITFWGEISRQDILPKGSAGDIRAAAAKMKQLLFVNGGGLIGQSETGKDVPLENIEALLTSWY